MAQQYKIPQNIDVEDKILGPFTLRQFLYMIVGGITIYILFNIIGIANFTLFIAISIPIAMMTLALVFVKINERPFLDFFFYFLQYLREPREKKWIKSIKIKTFESAVKISPEELAKQKEMARQATQGIARSQLNRMALLLDTQGWSQSDTNTSLAGRVVSAGETKSALTKLVKADENLDDMFSDIGEAVEGVQIEVKAEGGAEELGDKLRELLG